MAAHLVTQLGINNGPGGQLFGRRKRGSKDELPLHLQNGWTQQMLQAAVGREALEVEAAKSRQYPVKDHTVYPTGFGVAVNNFEVQRIIWGWVDLGIDRATFKPLLIPAYVRIDLAENENDAAYRYRIDKTLLRQSGPRGESLSEYENEATQPSQPRHVVGLVTLDGRYGDNRSEQDTESQRGVLPLFEINLKLTAAEWAPIRECIEVGRWRDGRGLALSVRIEFPERIEIAQLTEKPWGRNFPIIRFWVEAVVGLGPGLDSHPLFKSDMESGSIARLF